MAWYPRRNKAGQEKKMGNTHSLCSLNHSHRSKLESAVCEIIRLRELAGELKLLQVEDHVYLTRARICYIPDFKCQDVKTGNIIFIEAKGFANDRWPIIKKLWKVYGLGKLEIWKGTHARPFLDETIVPEK